MKRIIPAVIILIFTISLCICSHTLVDRACDATQSDINDYRNNSISADKLEQLWQKRKEKMSLFVNHGFLDDITIHIGQLTAYDNPNDERFDNTLKSIQTLLTMIKEEQQLAAHSFY